MTKSIRQKKLKPWTTTSWWATCDGCIAGGALKLSINTAAFADCSTYMTSDGQAYVPLVISMGALQKVLSGERAVDHGHPTPRLNPCGGTA